MFVVVHLSSKLLRDVNFVIGYYLGLQRLYFSWILLKYFYCAFIVQDTDTCMCVMILFSDAVVFVVAFCYFLYYVVQLQVWLHSHPCVPH